MLNVFLFRLSQEEHTLPFTVSPGITTETRESKIVIILKALSFRSSLVTESDVMRSHCCVTGGILGMTKVRSLSTERKTQGKRVSGCVKLAQVRIRRHHLQSRIRAGTNRSLHGAF